MLNDHCGNNREAAVWFSLAHSANIHELKPKASGLHKVWWQGLRLLVSGMISGTKVCVCVSTPVSKGTNLAIPTTSAREAMYSNSAGGQSSLMLLCPMKLCIREGSIHWPWMCTCKFNLLSKFHFWLNILLDRLCTSFC